MELALLFGGYLVLKIAVLLLNESRLPVFVSNKTQKVSIFVSTVVMIQFGVFF